MCITNTINNQNTHDSVIQRPIRKSRTKTRRPKFLSLRSELISPKISQISPMTHHPSAPTPPPPPPQKQLTLFPLHPENLVEDREENVALMFENDVVSSCCSLGSFLPTYHNDMSSEEESRNLAEEAALVRTAMRSRERETGAEEKWVCYSEVVEKKEEPSWTAAEEEEEEEVEEVTSTATKKKKKVEMRGKQLRLKLDYEGILNAWSDKAPLFINGESPQTVPNLHDDGSVWEENRRSKMGSEGGGNVWKVPEIGWKVGGREASVLRYKEKRQSRLFSKRIRYQVRKLNAEKRPRMKGRFVKRN